MAIQVDINIDGLTLAQWLKKVDTIVAGRIGLTSADLADFCSYDLWADGASPADAAGECIAGDDTFADSGL